MITRREFLKNATLLTLGGLLGASLGKPIKVLAAEEVPHLPWPYEELDPEYVRKLGHLGYYALECGGGSFWAIMTALKEKVGYPYTLLPLPSVEEVQKAVEEHEHIQGMMQFGYGGAFGWGSLCGALNGSSNAIVMVTKNWDKIGKMLYRWYEVFPFPSEKSNELASKHQFLVKKYKSDKVLPRNVSHSVLCHVSVGKWCEISGYASGSPERSERCARLTGDVAAKAVELLNADLRGELDTVGKLTLSQTTADCRTCHYKGKNYEMGQFTRGFMQCESCHQDMRPHLDSVIRLKASETKPNELTNVTLAGGAAAAVTGVVAGLWAYSKKGGSKSD